jgi:hypothetical protein
MSYAAIAAALALDAELSASERLAALSLASYANRAQLAWPGDRVAAIRAGLSRSGYLTARRQLEQRGLLAIEPSGRERGSSTTVRLLFAESGPRWDGPLNVDLLQAILEHGRARGPARLLLAAMAVTADAEGAVAHVSREELCESSALPRTTFRRARAALLESGEISLDVPGGGRGHASRWTVVDPRQSGSEPNPVPTRRPVQMACAQALMLPVPQPATGATAGDERARSSVRSMSSSSGDDGVVPPAPGAAPPERRKGQRAARFGRDSGPETGPQTGPETGPETGPPHVRPGRESLISGSRKPPGPPARGSAGRIQVEKTHTTPTGRRRKRVVELDAVELCQGLRDPGESDRRAWHEARRLLAEMVGEETFTVWLEPLSLVAVSIDGTLVVLAPEATRAWVAKRFARVIARAGTSIGRRIVVADRDRAAAIRTGGVRPAMAPESTWRTTESDSWRSVDGCGECEPERRRGEDDDGCEPVGLSGGGVSAGCWSSTAIPRRR